MKLAVVGSRTFNDYTLLKNYIVENYQDIFTIVSGGAQGADKLAERYAKEYDLNIEVHIPEWSLYGKKAGAIRNKDIVDNCNQVLAFWDGISKGTEITIKMAEKANKPVKIVYF